MDATNKTTDQAQDTNQNQELDQSNNQATSPVQEVLDKPVETIDSKAQEISETLQINLPAKGLLLPIRLIALFTLLGGLSILGSAFADIVDSEKTKVITYIMRLSVGLLAVASAYGLIERERWAFWLYGVIVIIGLLNNPFIAVLPAIALVYLYMHRDLFNPSKLDKLLAQLWSLIKTSITKKEEKWQ